MVLKTFEGLLKAKPALLAVASLSLLGAHPGAHEGAPTAVLGAVTKPSVGTPVEIVEAFHSALKHGDTVGALALLDEKVAIFESGEVERDRAEYAAHHLQADAAFSAAVPRSLVSRTHGMQSDMAWVMSVEMVTGTYRTRAINSRSVETMMLRQVNGQWRIVHIHWSSADIS